MYDSQPRGAIEYQPSVDMPGLFSTEWPSTTLTQSSVRLHSVKLYATRTASSSVSSTFSAPSPPAAYFLKGRLVPQSAASALPSSNAPSIDTQSDLSPCHSTS